MSSIPELQQKIKLARGRLQAQPDSRNFAPLGDFLREAGQYREALLILDKGLQRFPGYVTGHIIKGRTLNESGYGSLGLEALQKALELDPQNILALDLIIGEATARKSWREVVGPLEKLVALEPEDEKLVTFLDRVRQKLVDDVPVPEVHEDYRHVVAEPVEEPRIEPVPKPDPEPEFEKTEEPREAPVPGASHITMTMVDIYLAQGYREMAITALEEILEANPGRHDVQEKLDGLLDDPDRGVPESRKEKLSSPSPPSAKPDLDEQRQRDKAQFTQWIKGVNEDNGGVVGEGKS